MVKIKDSIRVPIGELKFNNYNPNEMKPPIYRKLLESIEKEGFDVAVRVRPDPEGGYIIIDGEHRVRAMQDLGAKEVTIVIDEDITEIDAIASTINRNAIHGEAELVKLGACIKELELAKGRAAMEAALALSKSAIDKARRAYELDKEKIEEMEELEFERTVQDGDLWNLGRHRLYCGDSSRDDSFSVLFGNDRAHMIFTDPPYVTDYTSKTTMLNRVYGGDRNETPITGDSSTLEEFNYLMYKTLLSAYDYSVDGAPYYICCLPGNKPFLAVAEQLERTGWEFQHTLIWVKNRPVLSRSDYNYKHEFLCYGWKRTGKHPFYGPQSESTVWEVDSPIKSKLHPTMKPLELIIRAVRNSSKPGDIVADFFGGSGQTLLACEKIDRRCYIMEIEPNYCSMIIDRWEKMTGKRAERAKP